MEDVTIYLYEIEGETGEQDSGSAEALRRQDWAANRRERVVQFTDPSAGILLEPLGCESMRLSMPASGSFTTGLYHRQGDFARLCLRDLFIRKDAAKRNPLRRKNAISVYGIAGSINGEDGDPVFALRQFES
jgi:hypothetical protein